MKTKRFIMMFVAFVLIWSSLVIPAAAAGKAKEIALGDNSGYKIIVPNFIEKKKVKSEDMDGQPFEVDAIIMETPKKDKDGNYPIFEIVTSDSKAASLDSYPGTYSDGQLGNAYGNFVNGKMMYSPSFSIGRDLSEIVKDTVFIFNFSVFDAEGNYLFGTDSLYFVFENPASGSKPVEPTKPAEPVKTVTAKPSSSKIVVSGKEIAFEVYNIEGNNYFKLRDLAMVMNGSKKQFAVEWDDKTNSISLLSGKAYKAVGNELAKPSAQASVQTKPTSSKLYLDGQAIELPAYNIKGNNFFKLRDIAKAIDFNVTWDEATKVVGLDPENGYVDPDAPVPAEPYPGYNEFIKEVKEQEYANSLEIEKVTTLFAGQGKSSSMAELFEQLGSSEDIFFTTDWAKYFEEFEEGIRGKFYFTLESDGALNVHLNTTEGMDDYSAAKPTVTKFEPVKIDGSTATPYYITMVNDYEAFEEPIQIYLLVDDQGIYKAAVIDDWYGGSIYIR